MNRRLEYRAPCEDLVLTEAAIPDPPEEGAVVKLHYSGICHSDLHMWQDKFDLGGGKTLKTTTNPAFKFPSILGHEMSGEILSIGENASNERGMSVGSRVMVYPWGGCGCQRCKDQKITLCLKGAALSMGVCLEGGFQQFVVARNLEILFPVPDGLPMDVAALMPCSGVTAYGAIKKVEPVVHDFISSRGSATLLIVGAGGLGLWGIQIAKYLMPKETRIIVAEAWENKLEEATKAGADETILWNPADSPEVNIGKLKELVPEGVDAGVDFVGSGNTTTSLFGHLSMGGSMVIIGLFGGIMFVSTPVMVLRENTVSGQKYGNPDEMVEAAKLAAQGKIQPPPISHVKLEEAQTVLEGLRDGKRRGRTVIKF